jgi:LEA14-like dessication related protein
MLRLLGLLAVCAFSIGCSALNLQKPTADVTGMAVQNVNASGFTMNFDVEVKNPNALELPTGAADYKLGLSGVNVVNGAANPAGSIPAGGSKHVTLPVTLTYENLLAAEQGIVKSGGNVPYSLDAGLSFNTGSPFLGNVRVPLQYSGTLPLKDILNNPQALMQNQAAQKLAKQLLNGIFSR